MDEKFLKSSSAGVVELPEKEKQAYVEGLKKAIIISGPTATGKTDLSIVLAKALGGEIVSADSMQVYREMDIGTAKATVNQRKGIPHHLIDIKDLSDSFNVVQFYEESLRLLENIFARDRVPIIVGGTGFYIHTLLYGPPLGPPANQHVRKKLEEDMDKFGSEPLYRKLLEYDPVYAKKITFNDRHKIIRALEIITLTNKKVSDFFRSSDAQFHPEYNFRCWFTYYPKSILYPRIEERCEKMIEQGFLEEVENLKAKGLEKNLSASQAIGYRQALDYLKTEKTASDFDEFLLAFKRASKRYAKRQFTWFRKEPIFRWLNLEVCDKAQAAELILHDFENAL